MDTLGAPTPVEPLLVPAEYQPLFKYLRDRFADSLVLTFAQIEDLLGSTLPADARLTEAWWLPAVASGVPSAPSRAWRQANRTATPNLLARTVRFDRGPI